jgi:hypothetical protein
MLSNSVWHQVEIMSRGEGRVPVEIWNTSWQPHPPHWVARRGGVSQDLVPRASSTGGDPESLSEERALCTDFLDLEPATRLQGNIPFEWDYTGFSAPASTRGGAHRTTPIRGRRFLCKVYCCEK